MRWWWQNKKIIYDTWKRKPGLCTEKWRGKNITITSYFLWWIVWVLLIVSISKHLLKFLPSLYDHHQPGSSPTPIYLLLKHRMVWIYFSDIKHYQSYCSYLRPHKGAFCIIKICFKIYIQQTLQMNTYS